MIEIIKRSKMSRVNLSVPATRDKTPAPKPPAVASPNKKSGTLPKKNNKAKVKHVHKINLIFEMLIDLDFIFYQYLIKVYML